MKKILLLLSGFFGIALVAALGMAIVIWPRERPEPPLGDSEGGFPVSAAYRAADDLYRNKKFTAAFKAFLPLAEHGDPLARYRVAYMYDTGQGVPEDAGQAHAWYEKAADQGLAKALNNLGNLAIDGRGTPIDFAKAKTFYERASSLGYEIAARNLADMHSWPNSPLHDPEKARKYWHEAADRGDKLAQLIVAHRYYIKTDRSKYIEYLERAASQGSAPAYIGLATTGYKDYRHKAGYAVTVCVWLWAGELGQPYDSCDYLLSQKLQAQ